MAIRSVEPTRSEALRENLVLRAYLVPLAIIGPCFVISMIWAHFETHDPLTDQATGPALLALFVGPLVGITSTAIAASRRPLSTRQRSGLFIAGLAGAGMSFIIGAFALLWVMTAACDGAYECPF